MIRTLIVDDDFRVAALHRAYVEKVPGFTVVGEAGTGADALRLTTILLQVSADWRNAPTVPGSSHRHPAPVQLC